MKKRLFLLLFIPLLTFSQSDKNVSDELFKVNFLAPGVEYEIGVSNNSTINLNASLIFGLLVSDFFEDEFGFFPRFEGQYRYYYNFKRRLEKGKRTSHNSANYFSLASSILIGESLIGSLDTVEDYVIWVGPKWGMQRTYESGFNLSFEAGVAYGFDDMSDSTVFPTLNFKIGWVLGKNK